MSFNNTNRADEREAARWEEDSDTILGSQRLPIQRRPGERVIIPRARLEISAQG